MDLLVRFVGIWMVFILYIAVGVEGVAYGEACTGIGSGDCTDINVICDTICICSTDSFRKSNDVECATKILLHDACTFGEPADQCIDSNAECRDNSGFTCVCKDALFENRDGTCVPQVHLNGACDLTDSASDQCSVANSECRDDGAGTYKCLCSTTYYENGDACLSKLYPEVSCSGDQCVSDATCVSNTCECNTGFKASPANSPTACINSGDVKVMIQQYMYVLPILVSMMFILL